MRNKNEMAYEQDILSKAESICVKFNGFTDGIRVLFLIHRNKEGGPTNNAKVRKVITKGSKEFAVALCDLLKQKQESELTLRIYASVNSRKIEKAIRQFKFEMLEADYYEDEHRHGFYYDLKNRFIGCLMTPSSRDTSYFLLDVDDRKDMDAVMQKIAEAKAEIVLSYGTKNGWHYVTTPFNPALMGEFAPIVNKDGLLLLDF